jgi:hypothetical protein
MLILAAIPVWIIWYVFSIGERLLGEMLVLITVIKLSTRMPEPFSLISFAVCLVWFVWIAIRWCKSMNSENPYFRKGPYRRIHLDEDNIKFNPMNEQTPIQKGNDEKHS